MSEVVRIRKKPLEIDAVKWTTTNFDEVYTFTGGHIRTSPVDEFHIEVYDYLHDSWITVKPHDYVLRGLKGEYYPHDGELLWGSYDKV